MATRMPPGPHISNPTAPAVAKPRGRRRAITRARSSVSDKGRAIAHPSGTHGTSRRVKPRESGMPRLCSDPWPHARASRTRSRGQSPPCRMRTEAHEEEAQVAPPRQVKRASGRVGLRVRTKEIALVQGVTCPLREGPAPRLAGRSCARLRRPAGLRAQPAWGLGGFTSGRAAAKSGDVH